MRKSASFEYLFTLMNVPCTVPRWTENRRTNFQLSHVVLVHQLNAHSHSFIKIFSEKVRRKLTCRTHSINLSSLPCAGKFTALAFCTVSIVPVGRPHRCLSMHSKCFVISVTNRRGFDFMCHFHSRTPKLNWARDIWFSDAVYHACDTQLYPYHVVALFSPPLNAADLSDSTYFFRIYLFPGICSTAFWFRKVIINLHSSLPQRPTGRTRETKNTYLLHRETTKLSPSSLSRTQRIRFGLCAVRCHDVATPNLT